jgi:hypothetical protein
MKYLDRIAYNLACDNQDEATANFNLQVELNGPITAEQITYITKRRDEIVREWEMEMNEFRTHIG